jgi:hypothetical protein
MPDRDHDPPKARRQAGELRRVNLPENSCFFQMNRPLAHSGRAQAAIELIAVLPGVTEDKIQNTLDQTAPATFWRTAQDQQSKRYRMKR